jgi:hypothetical protein
MLSKARCLERLSNQQTLGKRARERVWLRVTEQFLERRKPGRKKSNRPAN